MARRRRRNSDGYSSGLDALADAEAAADFQAHTGFSLADRGLDDHDRALDDGAHFASDDSEHSLDYLDFADPAGGW
jgi:hypothetical protein